MASEIRVPTLGESVSEATIGKWFKKPGDAVKKDEPVLELETDKVSLEVNAPVDGVLAELTVKEGETVGVGALLGTITAGAGAAAAPQTAPAAAAPASAAKPAAAPAVDHGPAVSRLAAESGVNPTAVAASGKDGRVTKGDMLAAIATGAAPSAAPVAVRAPSAPDDGAREERVRMTKLRQTIARRLKDAQNTAAMLTTFNEVDMTEVMALRNRYKDVFEKKHGNKLGFMGFFVKACVQALKDLPAVNAEIDGTDLVYKNYYHIGIAVGTDKGLVVPVLRNAERMSFAEVEVAIEDFGKRAKENKIKLDEYLASVREVEDAGAHLLSLINDILDLSRIETGNRQVERHRPEHPRLPEGTHGSWGHRGRGGERWRPSSEFLDGPAPNYARSERHA